MTDNIFNDRVFCSFTANSVKGVVEVKFGQSAVEVMSGRFIG
jgi:hypothetical protein